MEDKENKNKKLRYNKRDNFDDSKLSVNSDVHYRRYDNENKENVYEQSNLEKMENNQISIIEEETKNYVDEMKKGSYNILVAVRSRPLNQKEKEFSEFEIVKILDKKMVILIDPYEYNAPTDVFKNRSREQQYAFDFAFDKNCSSKEVFNSTTKFLLDGVVNGYNATVFAYGATGAGKTYTMLGHEEESGIMFLTIEELFTKISSYSADRDYKIKLWYLEIYNENIKDLLCPNDENLDLREDPQKGTIVSNITELNVSTSKDIMHQLRIGNKNRTQEATNANETSSRSHAILQVLVEYKDKVTGVDAEIKIGKLSLIDLAGSERAKETLNKGIRLIEGANINRSLLTLGNCINALCEANEKGTKPYVPYRDSKLTRLLKDSLGGNSRTVMIANVSPSVSTFGDTYNTLKYANRAKNIKTNVTRNTTNVQYHISNYNQIITNLKNEITELKGQLTKKDQTLNNIIPSNKMNENKINELKEGTTKTQISLFEKAVTELKSHCEDEITLKQKIINLKQDIRKMNQIINSKKAENLNSKQHLSFNNKREKNEFSNEKDDETTKTINLDEKENLLNHNNSIVSNSQMININSSSVGDASININLNLSTNIDNKDQKILEAKLMILMKNHDKFNENFKSLIKKRENLMNKYSENGIKDFHYEYLESLLKAHNLKLFIIENKFKEKFNNNLSQIKENYISILEDQLKIRDNLIKKSKLNGIFDDELENVKSLDQLKNDYTSKLPLINNKNISRDNNSTIDTNFSFLSGGNLPQIKQNSNNNLQSMLNDIKSVNNNISRIENDSKNNPNNSNLIRIDQKSKFKSEITNKLESIGNNNLKLKIINRKPTQGKNSNPYANKNENSNVSIVNNFNNIHPNVNTSNGVQLQNKNLQGKYITNNYSNNYSRKSKQIKLNLINPKIKENYSEKSDSNNMSNEYDSYLIDQDNSVNESRLRNLRNRRSAQPKLKDENMYSPLRILDKKNPTSLRKVVDNIPQIKKKDLNIFLNEKNKYKNQRKINLPFK